MLFPAELSSVRAARQWVAQSAREHGASAAAERLATLLASELVTNAVKYGGTSGSIAIDVRYTDGAVRVLVSDDSPQLPVVLDPPATSTGGRGMRLIDTLSTRWGVDRHPGAGKTVWFQLDLDVTWPAEP